MAATFACAERQFLRTVQNGEIIFRDNPGRWVLLPVEFPTIFKFYKALENQYWTPSPLIWDQSNLVLQISGTQRQLAERKALAVYSVLVDQKLFKGFPSHPLIDTKLYPDVLDQLCGITDFVQSPEARAFIGFQNMLEDFHREALNSCLVALKGVEPDSTNSLDSDICVPHVRHTCSKAFWLYAHLAGLSTNDSHRLPGDSGDYTPKAADEPCLAEALVALTVSKCLYNTCAVRAVMAWILVDDTCPKKGEESQSTDALTKFLTHFLKDMHVFGDFYAHLYCNLEYKLAPASLYKMLSEAIIIEYQYLNTVFHTLGESNQIRISDLGALAKTAAVRVISSCGESTAEFQQYYDSHESALVAEVQSVCWPLIEEKRDTQFDQSSLPFMMFDTVPGDWHNAPLPSAPITAFSTGDGEYYAPADTADNLQMNEANASTNATTSNVPGLQFDEDF